MRQNLLGDNVRTVLGSPVRRSTSSYRDGVEFNKRVKVRNRTAGDSYHYWLGITTELAGI